MTRPTGHALTRQVAAFDDEANRIRRARNDQRLAEATWFEAARREVEQAVNDIVAGSDRQLPAQAFTPPVSDMQGIESASGLDELADQLTAIRERLSADVAAATTAAMTALATLAERRRSSAWQQQVDRAAADSQAYQSELAALGLDSTAYAQVREQLRVQAELLEDLDRRAARIPELETAANTAWAALVELHEQRHIRRRQLLDEIEQRSGILRFSLQPASDTTSWVTRVRELLGLRSDGFLEEVPALAQWLWAAVPEHDDRLRLWRSSCVTGDLDELVRQARLRTGWATRLRKLDPVVRTRLAAEIADETVAMEFRRSAPGLGKTDQWVALTAGSPGQRSAAMLSFVLHHGTEPLVLDQPEDDLDTEWITQLVVTQLRTSRWSRQVVVVTHNANIPVNADAERVIVLENTAEGVRVRVSTEADGTVVEHCGALEEQRVRADIQKIMEGGVEAFVRRERRYNNELNTYRAAMRQIQPTG